VRGRKKPYRKTVGRMVRIGRPDHARACSLVTFVCVFFLGPALLSGGLASIGPADGEAATQEFSIGAGRGKAWGFPPGALGGEVSAGRKKGTGYIYGPSDRKCTLSPFPGCLPLQRPLQD
jgi:hypothetical protein